MSAQEFDAFRTSPPELPLASDIPLASLTYAEVMSRTTYLRRANIIPYTGYSAILYARWFPFAVFLPILAAVGILASLFLPWFSIGSLTYNGFHIATSGANLVIDSFSFPYLWIVVLLALALIAWSAFLLWSKIVTASLMRSLLIGLGLISLIDVIYLCISTFASFPVIRSQGFIVNGPGIGPTYFQLIGPSYGAWISLAVSFIALVICYILLTELHWYWYLSQEGVRYIASRTKGFSIPPEFFR